MGEIVEFMSAELSDRERTVLRYLVHDFIETATPIGSRYISRRHEAVLGLSSASIRNVMSDLEYLGYLNHPHTSAGRVPTDLGYRFYLDQLMEVEKLTRGERDAIRRNLDPAVLETDDLLKETSRILGKISRQLCVVTSPHLSSGTLEKMELVSITSNKLLVILSIKSGLVRTIMMEVISEIPREKLEELVRLLNERLSGLSLADIRDTFVQRVEDVRDEDTGLIRLFIESVDKVFSGNKAERLHIAGAENMVQQPEFVSPENFRSVVELINNEEIIIHVLEKSETSPRQVRVAVGDENVDPMLKPYGVITSMYTVGDITGTVGMIGPKRMAYARMIPLVDYVAKTISELFASSYKSS